MFAFAIWERDSGRVLFGRDRLGIKPFYYTEVDGALRFASSLPALVKAGGVDTGIDPVALNSYLSFHAVVPAPYTLLQGVRKLPVITSYSIHYTKLYEMAVDEAAPPVSVATWLPKKYLNSSTPRGVDMYFCVVTREIVDSCSSSSSAISRRVSGRIATSP